MKLVNCFVFNFVQKYEVLSKRTKKSKKCLRRKEKCSNFVAKS